MPPFKSDIAFLTGAMPPYPLCYPATVCFGLLELAPTAPDALFLLKKLSAVRLCYYCPLAFLLGRAAEIGS